MKSGIARKIGRILGTIFGSPRDSDLAPGQAARALAEYISGTEGSSLIWCSCGELLAPVVFSDGENPAEIISLGCIHGHGRIPVNVGVLSDHESRP